MLARCGCSYEAASFLRRFNNPGIRFFLIPLPLLYFLNIKGKCANGRETGMRIKSQVHSQV